MKQKLPAIFLSVLFITACNVPVPVTPVAQTETPIDAGHQFSKRTRHSLPDPVRSISRADQQP